jgi:hypothetical protein
LEEASGGEAEAVGGEEGAGIGDREVMRALDERQSEKAPLAGEVLEEETIQLLLNEVLWQGFFVGDKGVQASKCVGLP